MFYKNIVNIHFENPLNTKKLDIFTNKIIIGDPKESIIELRANILNDTIIDISYKVHGCAAMIACMSVLSEKVKGLKIEDVRKINYSDLNNLLCLEPVKYNCSILAIEAINKLIKA